MKKLIIIAAFLSLTVRLYANQRISGNCSQGGKVVTAGLNSTNSALLSFAGATVTVNIHGSGLATIFSDNIGTPLSNPFTAGSDSSFGFYVANSRVDVVCSGTGLPTVTFSDILANDPASPLGCLSVPTFIGDVTSLGSSCTLTLPNIASAGTGLKTTINAKGQVTGVATAASTDLSDTAIIARLNAAANFGANPITGGPITGTTGTFSGAITDAGETASGEIAPSVTGIQLGDTSHRWDAFVRNLDVANPVTALTVGTLTVTGNETIGGTLVITGAFTGSSGTFSSSLTAASGIITGNLAIGGGSPWFDVTAPACGAKGDGVTDDTAAINTCLTSAKNASGGYVFFPSGKTYLISGQINCDSCTNVVLKGFAGLPWTPNATTTPLPLLKFTGSTSPLVSLRSTQGVGIEGLNLQQTNNAFTGLFITVEHVTTNDSQGDFFRYMSIAGTTTSANSTCLLCLDKADDTEISHVQFNYAVNAIRGEAAGGSYSFTVHINNSNFSTSTGTISGGMIINPGGGWIIGPNNDFEMGTALGNPNVLDCTTTCSVGLVFRDNFVGDTTAGWTGTVIKNFSSNGLTVQGNEATGAATGSFITLASAATGIIITGNYVQTFGTCLTFTASNQVQVTVLGNFWGACTTFQSGAPRGQGLVQDNTNLYTVYGAMKIDNSVGSFAPAATNQVDLGSSSLGWTNVWQFITDYNETTAPTGVSTFDKNWGDSTLHGQMYNDNNAGPTARGSKAVLTADWTCGTGGTVASCTSATIIGSGGGVPMTFNLPLVAGSYQLDCDFIVAQTTADTANGWNLLTATNGASNTEAYYFFPVNGATAPTLASSTYITGQGSTTTTFQIGGNWTLGALIGTAKYPVHIHAAIEGASASGTVLSAQLVAPTVADLVTIFRGGSCWLH